MAFVTIAAIAARSGNGGAASDGVYQTNQRPIPAGFYDRITVSLTFGPPGTGNPNTDFATGDKLEGLIETSVDGGQTWRTLMGPARWVGGLAKPADPEKGTPAVVPAVNANGVTIAAGTLYRASVKVIPGAGPAASLTFGAQAEVILKP